MGVCVYVYISVVCMCAYVCECVQMCAWMHELRVYL